MCYILALQSCCAECVSKHGLIQWQHEHSPGVVFLANVTNKGSLTFPLITANACQSLAAEFSTIFTRTCQLWCVPVVTRQVLYSGFIEAFCRKHLPAAA